MFKQCAFRKSIVLAQNVEKCKELKSLKSILFVALLNPLWRYISFSIQIKTRVQFNTDVLEADQGECIIYYEDLLAGQTIARVPCLCIFHVECLKDWFKVKGRFSMILFCLSVF